MDDLLSRVTIDPLAIKYPSRGETASAGLVAETTVNGCLDNLDGRVTALEDAPAPSGASAILKTGVVTSGDWTFEGAPASPPKYLKLYAFGHVENGNMTVEVIGNVMLCGYAVYDYGRNFVLSSGLTRINGGVNFTAGNTWVVNNGAPNANPFLGLTVTALAIF